VPVAPVVAAPAEVVAVAEKPVEKEAKPRAAKPAVKKPAAKKPVAKKPAAKAATKPKSRCEENDKAQRGKEIEKVIPPRDRAILCLFLRKPTRRNRR